MDVRCHKAWQENKWNNKRDNELVDESKKSPGNEVDEVSACYANIMRTT